MQWQIFCAIYLNFILPLFLVFRSLPFTSKEVSKEKPQKRNSNVVESVVTTEKIYVLLLSMAVFFFPITQKNLQIKEYLH